MMTTPFLRSPIRSPTRLAKNRSTLASDDEENHHRHRKTAGVSNPYILGTVIVILFAATYFWGPSSELKTVSTGGFDASPASPPVAASTARPSLHLLGERHSGTKWMTDHLTECFGDDVEVRKSFSAWKHWFQKENPLIPNAVIVAQLTPFYDKA